MKFLPLREITTTSAAPAGVPATALGGRPSDAYKRMTFKKLKKNEYIIRAA
jgi:hypothetical protein